MVRVLVAFGLLVFVLVLLVGSWMAANRQLGEAWASCMTEMKVEQRLPALKNAADITRLLAETVDCADARKGPLADLFFGRDALLERYEQKLRMAALAQAQADAQMREYEETQQQYMDEYEGARNLQEFREDVYRGQR